MDEFKKKKDEAIVKLGTLVENPVENSEDGVHKALAFVFGHGTANDKATAIMIVGQWMWANCEMSYHAMKQNQNQN